MLLRHRQKREDERDGDDEQERGVAGFLDDATARIEEVDQRGHHKAHRCQAEANAAGQHAGEAQQAKNYSQRHASDNHQQGRIPAIRSHLPLSSSRLEVAAPPAV